VNATEIRDYHIANVYEPLVKGTLKPAQAKEANNALGKVLGTAKVQLEAVALSKDRPKDVRQAIPFLK
jgi:hypothetical protein